MTVITAFNIDGVPVILGDLLTTGPTQNSSAAVALPALGNVQDFFGDSGWSVTGLRQKVTLISPTCVIAWAGSFIGARLAIAEIKLRSNKGDLSAEEILEYLKSEPELTSHPASFVGFTIAAGGVYQFKFDAEQFENPSLGTVFLTGTGAQSIHEFADFMSQGVFDSTGNGNPVLDAVCSTLMLCGMLLQAEFRGGDTATTIQNMFGGGYELAILTNDQFVKVDEITYVFWEAGFLPDRIGLTMPQFVVKQKYKNDHLLLRSVHFSPALLGQKLELTQDQRHVILPMFDSDDGPSVEDLASLQLQSRLFCHCVLVRDEHGFRRMFTLVQNYARLEDAKIEFIDIAGKVELKLDRELISQIGNRLQEIRASGQ